MRNVRLVLGATVRRLREKRDVSQEAFAASARIGRSYFGRIERGTVNVSIDNIAKIIGALNTTFADFFAEFEKQR